MVAILKEIRILKASSHSNTSSITPEHATSTAAFHVGSKHHTAANKQQQQQNVKDRKRPCIYSKGHHAATVCDAVCDPERRYELVKTQNLCFNCLTPHKASQCSSKHRCKVCNKKHHTSLCRNVSTAGSEVAKTEETTTPPTTHACLTPVAPSTNASTFVSAYWRLLLHQLAQETTRQQLTSSWWTCSEVIHFCWHGQSTWYYSKQYQAASGCNVWITNPCHVRNLKWALSW